MKYFQSVLSSGLGIWRLQLEVKFIPFLSLQFYKVGRSYNRCEPMDPSTSPASNRVLCYSINI